MGPEESVATQAARKTMKRVERELVPVDREVLNAIPITERGDRSDRWAGVQHGVLANAVLSEAAARDFFITREIWKVSKDGARLFGDLTVDHKSGGLNLGAGSLGHDVGSGYMGFDPTIMGLHLGIMSSNDSTIAFTMIVIARVLVCSNGMTVDGGHIAARRKHTTRIGSELREVVSAGLDTYALRVGTIESTRHQLQELDFGRQVDVDHTMMEAGRRGLFPWSKLGRVEQEWRDIRHPEFQDRTGWSLMNCFSEVAKRFNPVREISTVDRVRELIMETAPNNN